MGLAESVIGRWAPILVSVELVSGKHGVFKVDLDGDTVFDKQSIGRHAKKGEVESLLEPALGPPLDWK